MAGSINNPTHDQANLDWRMLHEGAHSYDFANHAPEREADWERAIAADARYASDYARTGGPREDYAESMVMYALVVGGECEPYARKMFPARFALLDRWLGDRYQ